MARPQSRKRRRATADLSIRQLRHRMSSALERGAFQKAQAFANTLYQREPTPENRHAMLDASLKRAAQLRRANDSARALSGLKKLAADAVTDPTWAVPWLRELMLAGDWESANALADHLPSDDLQTELLAAQVDVALLQGADRVGELPDAIRPGAQAVLHALSELDQGRDAEAEVFMANLPEDSPLHEWKCLVQGLVAFHQGGDALVHWQRLTPSRIPATLAVPIHVQLDPSILSQHPNPNAVATLRRHPLQEVWLEELETAQQELDIETMFHILSHLRTAAQHLPEQQGLRDRLTRVVYWLMAKQGYPEDLDAYTASFEPPPDDPALHRLRALMHEQAGETAEAQHAWAAYAEELDANPMIQANDRDLARGLIWFHMGELAERPTPGPPVGGLPFLPEIDEAPAFDSLHCFQESVKLAPTLLIAHEAVIDRLHAAGKQRDKVKAARALLAQFPEHEPALVALADDASRRNRWDQAVTFQKRAVQARPHAEDLRLKLDFYELGLARLRAQQGKFEAARAILQAHIEKSKPAEHTRLLCRQAAVELKAGDQILGESLYEQAQAAAHSPLTAAFNMLIEAVRMPVAVKWSRQVEREFRRELKSEWHSPSACQLLDMLVAFASQHITYEAFDQHQKWVFQYLRRGLKEPLSEAELCHLCNGLKYFASEKLFLDYARRGQKECPDHPLFPMSVAVSLVTRDPEKCPWNKADDLLHRAHDLAAADPAHADLMEPIDALLDVVHHALEIQRFSTFQSRFEDGFDDGPSPFELLNALEQLIGSPLDDDDDDNDDDMFDFFNPFGPPPGRRRSTAKNRRRRNR